MAEANAGAAGAAGGAGAGGAGAAGAGGAGAAGAGGAGAAGAGAAGAAPEWHGQTDAEVVAYINNKGWKSPGDLLASYRGAEKLIGADPASVLRVPRADDPDGFRQVAAKLGMPEKASDYKLDVHKDLPASDEYQAFVRETFHQAGLTGNQAAAISKAHNEYLAKQAAQAARDYDLNIEADKRTLLQEWGGGHERMMNRAKTAARALGFPGEAIDAIEKAMGYANTMKFFAEIGGKIGEDTFTGSNNSGGQRFSNTMTPAEAQAEWQAMSADANQRAALLDGAHPQHKAAIKKQADLFAIMYPGE